MDSTTLSPEKVELATVTRNAETGEVWYPSCTYISLRSTSLYKHMSDNVQKAGGCGGIK